MLWYKAWFDTRWRFLIGLAVVLCSAVGTVMLYPQVRDLLAAGADPAAALPGRMAQEVREKLDLARSFRGYVWSNWFGQNMPQQWTVLAALIGTGGLAAQAKGGGALFILSLPVSRGQILRTRVLTGMGELALIALVPALAVSLASPLVGESFPARDALVFGTSIFVCGSVIFSLAVWLSTLFTDFWRPALIALGVAMAASLGDQASRLSGGPGLADWVSASGYFHGGQPPWLGWLACAALSAALIYAADRTLARRDF